MPIDPILQKDLLYNDILNKFEPLDHTETLQVELLSLPVNSYKYIQLTGLPLNQNYIESFQIEVTRDSDSFAFSETSQGNDIQPTQFWVNYHEQNLQQNGRIYFNNDIIIGESFTVRYPFIGTANNARNIYELASKQLYELQLTNGKLDANNLVISNIANGTSSSDAVNFGQLTTGVTQLNAGNKKILNVANGTSSSDAVNFGQLTTGVTQLNAGNKRILNVANGISESDAVNFGQLDDRIPKKYQVFNSTIHGFDFLNWTVPNTFIVYVTIAGVQVKLKINVDSTESW